MSYFSLFGKINSVKIFIAIIFHFHVTHSHLLYLNTFYIVWMPRIWYWYIINLKSQCLPRKNKMKNKTRLNWGKRGLLSDKKLRFWSFYVGYALCGVYYSKYRIKFYMWYIFNFFDQQSYQSGQNLNIFKKKLKI